MNLVEADQKKKAEAKAKKAPAKKSAKKEG